VNSRIISFLRKLLKIEVFERIMMKSADFTYLTPEYVSELEGISEEAAEDRLEKASEKGFLQKRYLYTNIDLDLNLIVDESHVGMRIKVENLPESFESDEIFISPMYVKKVYVTA
jgi:hypothetical protein